MPGATVNFGTSSRSATSGTVSDNGAGHIWTVAGSSGATANINWQYPVSYFGIPSGSTITSIVSTAPLYVYQESALNASGNYYASCQLGVLYTWTTISRSSGSPNGISVNKTGSYVVSGNPTITLLSFLFENLESFYTSNFYADKRNMEFTVNWTEPPRQRTLFFGTNF